jgi:glycosyltransferase involved in cell wall biosynthesis
MLPMEKDRKRKVIFATPSLTGPFPQYVDALIASLPLIEAAGYEHSYVQELGCPYISGARATMTRKALDAGADIIVYIDSDLSWDPPDLLKLIETEGDVVAGTYRIKHEPEEYMSTIESGLNGRPLVRADGAIKAKLVPAGFLKITKEGINKFIYAYPELTYGPLYSQSIDLFNHGAVLGDRLWWGEDYCFSWRWNAKCGEIWLVPNLNITHHWREAHPKTRQWEYKVFPGNFHNFLRRQDGGDLSANPIPPVGQTVLPMRSAA